MVNSSEKKRNNTQSKNYQDSHGQFLGVGA